MLFLAAGARRRIVKPTRKIALAVLLAGCLSLGGCATLAQDLIAGLAADSSCRSHDTGPDGRSYYDSACLSDIDQWQDDNPM